MLREPQCAKFCGRLKSCHLKGYMFYNANQTGQQFNRIPGPIRFVSTTHPSHNLPSSMAPHLERLELQLDHASHIEGTHLDVTTDGPFAAQELN